MLEKNAKRDYVYYCAIVIREARVEVIDAGDYDDQQLLVLVYSGEAFLHKQPSPRVGFRQKQRMLERH